MQHRLFSFELKDLPEAVESTVSLEHPYEMQLTFEHSPLSPPHNYWIEKSLSV